MLSMKTIAMMCAEVVDNLGNTDSMTEVMTGILYALEATGELSGDQSEQFMLFVDGARSDTAGIALAIDNNPSWEC